MCKASKLTLFLGAIPWILPPKGRGGPPNTPRAVMTLILVFMLVYAATIIAFFVTGRYRVTLVPFVAMGAGVGLVRGFDFIRTRRGVAASVLATVVLLLWGILKLDFFNIGEEPAEFVRLTTAHDHLQLGEWDKAIQELDAIRQARRLAAVEVYLSLARAHLHRGASGAAAAILAVAADGLQQYPDTPALLWYAAVGRVQQNDWPQARRWIEHYLRLEPNEIPGLHLATLVASKQNRHADAQEALRRAQAIDPHHPAIRDMGLAQ